jgi:hypothetical protein
MTRSPPSAVAVVEAHRLQKLMRHICKNGLEHHGAMNASSCGTALAAAMQDYLGWDVYGHEIYTLA